MACTAADRESRLRKGQPIRVLRLILLCWLVTAALALEAATARAAEDRFLAWLADGSKLTATSLPSWPIPGVPYRFENQDLLASENPVRFVRDVRANVTLRAPFLVLANGDLLCGVPVELEDDAGRVGLPSRVNVQLESPLMPVSGAGISVRTDRIQRIVASALAPANAPPPGTVLLADGRRLVARSIRWRQYGLALLTAEGLVEALFGDLVDVVFPRVDTLAAVLDDNLWAGSSSGSSLARFQMSGGSLITAARASREREQSRGRGRLVSSVYYYVQPAWADQPLALPEQDLAWCGYRSASELPLSLLPAETLANRRLIGHPQAWIANRGQLSASLATGGRESDLGISTHAHSAIAFALPHAAKSLMLGVGIDRAMGRGGCVRCKIMADAENGPLLWDSGVFQGQDGLKSAGPISVADISRVVLVTESAALADRPSGADPLDLRDQVVWLSPLVTLESAAHSPADRARAVIPGLEDWQLMGDDWSTAQLSHRWNIMNSDWDAVLSLPRGSELRLTRTVDVTSQSDVLELLTSCPSDLAFHDISLRAEGKEVTWTNNTDRNQLRQWVTRYGRTRTREDDDESQRTDRLAYWWDLKPWRGQQVQLELALRAESSRGEIACRGLALRTAVAVPPDHAAASSPEIPLSTLAPLEAAPPPRGRGSKSAAPAPRPTETVRFLGQQFSGYSLPRNTALAFRIQPEFKRFVAIVGCAQQSAGPVRILLDGRPLWERTAISALSPAEPIDLAIPTGSQRLTIEHGDGANYGLAALANAGFTK